ncbi:MAG TPA: glycosyltransferase family 2 protein [Candidatus Saccharimonadia bacterium]|nr:glycosyltransferase family 2 protein [Candidatus Saccharimonadia bacterium]
MKCPWKSLSVFFPVFNEAEVLPDLVHRALEVLEGFDLEAYEVIVIDDGSADASGKIADGLAMANKHVRVVHHERNMGYGAALSSGFAAARYDWVVYTDGDGQFDLSDLARFFEGSQRADAVLGYRRERQDHLGRKLNAWLWGGLVRLVLGLKVRDVDCGFKLIKTDRVRGLGTLSARGAVISPELLLKLRAGGCRWEEVEVRHYPRMTGAPSGANLKVILRAVRELWQLRRTLGA